MIAPAVNKTSALDRQSPRRLDWPVGRAYVVTVLLAACLYGLTAQRGPTWQDSGYHQLRALRLDLNNPLGLALSHSLMIVAAQPLKFLFGPALLPTVMNIVSGIGMAIAVANVLLLGYWLTGRPAAAILAAAMLAVCHTAWWLATISETYCWVTTGLTTELLLLVSLLANPRPWKLLLLMLISGLGFSLHNLALLPLPVYAVTAVLLVARRRVPAWALLAAVACWLCGAALQLGLVIQAGLSNGWGWAINSALFGSEWAPKVASLSPHRLKGGVIYVLLNWPFLSLVPVLLGWWLMPGRAGRAMGTALGTIAAIELIFGIRYDVPDQFMFLLPAYALLAIGAAVGIDRLLALPARARRVAMVLVVASLALTPVLYGLAPWVMTRMGRSLRHGYHLPYRDENRYWITPWKFNEHSADRFARGALAVAAPDGVILASGTMGPPIMVVQAALGLSPQVTIEMMEEPRLGIIPPLKELILDDPAQVARIVNGRALFIVAPGKFDPQMGERMGQCPQVTREPLIQLQLPAPVSGAAEKSD